MNREEHRFFPLLGRILLSLIFIIGALSKIFDLESGIYTLKQAGIESGVRFYLYVAIALELIGGILILLGWKTRWGAALLMIFLFPVTVIAHGFWNFEGAQQANQAAHFFKNVAIYGGLILLMVYGPGKWSLDGRQK